MFPHPRVPVHLDPSGRFTQNAEGNPRTVLLVDLERLAFP